LSLNSAALKYLFYYVTKKHIILLNELYTFNKNMESEYEG
jgi:hypothetical protein